MQQAVVIIGIGELGGVFARGLLRSGRPVYPVTRDVDMHAAAAAMPEPELVLVAVVEDALHAALGQIPAQWRGRLCLLQNEVLRRDWQARTIARPTEPAVRCGKT